jgi:arsenite methyltransferase
MKPKDEDAVHAAVRSRYAAAAEGIDLDAPSCDCASTSSCCGASSADEREISRRLGYSEDELASVPAGANLGLGCGNPQAIAALKPGEVVLDLGSGAGFDVFLAAKQVGETGRVIGVDMTPEMLAKARENAKGFGFRNTEFRLGEIEHLPVADGTVDVIISNCVINLSPDKPAVFHEAFRVLKPGGRLAVSDVVATAPLPQPVVEDMRLLCACISGACQIDELQAILAETGFDSIRIQPKDESREFIRDWQPGSKLEDFVVSATIEAVKRGRFTGSSI